MKAQQHFYRIIGLAGLILLHSLSMWAQCNSCDHTINGNFSGNLNASNGDVVCITSSGNFSGNLNGNNLTICNNGIISSQNFNPSNYTFYNYGTVNSSHLNINSNCTVHNYGTIGLSGQLNVNNGGVINNHFLINVSGHMHINGVVRGNTLGGNGRINVNGQTTINNGGTFGVIGSIDLCDAGNPSGGWDNKIGLVGNSVTYCEFGPSNQGEFISVQNGNWSSGSTWGNSGNTLGQSYPGLGDSVVIKSPHRVNLQIHGESEVVNVESGARLLVKASKSITVSDYLINDGLIVVNNNASILQTDCSGADKNIGSGTYRIKRTGSDTSICYNMWSSPLKAVDLSTTFNGTNPCDIYTFNGTDQAWCYDYSAGYTTSCNGNPVVFSSAFCLPNGDGVMDIGRGYLCAGGSANKKVKKFQGQINNGNIKVALLTTNNGNQPDWNDDDWNMIGNPYPSALSASQFWQENAINNNRIFGAIHFWDDGGNGVYNQYNEYATWNSLGGVSSGNSGVVPSGNIGSCQGFWVEATSNDTLVFTNCMRNNNNNQFFKSAPQVSSIYLTLSSNSSINPLVKNILVGFNNETSNAYDALYDAHQIADQNPLQLASLIDSSTFVIQGVKRPQFSQNTNVPLFIKSQRNGTHIISASELINLPDQLSVYLKDKQTNTRVNLKDHHAQIHLDSNVAYYNRFELELSMSTEFDSNLPDTVVKISETLPVNSIAESNNVQLLIQDRKVTLVGLIQENSSLTIFNLTGQTLSQKQLITGEMNVEISLNQFSQPVIIAFKNSKQKIVRKVFF